MIRFDDVSVRYDGAAADAVKKVSLEISAGQFVALVGESGSGKTTLLKAINRLHDPTSGAVRVDGVDVAQADPVSLRRSIGYVFQGIGLFPHLTVGENIAITPQLLGWSTEERNRRIAELLQLVELPADFAGRMPSQLSGGQQQRIGIARALAARPKILLMDEPFGALDPLTRDNLGEACRKLHDELGLTTVMVTHDVQEALLLSDRITVLREGEVIADGAPAALLARQDDAKIAALMDLPRRQAARVRALLEQTQGVRT